MSRRQLVVFCFFFLVVVVLVWAEAVREASGLWRVRASHQGRGLEAPLCQLCRAYLRVRVRSAGESSPAKRKARAQPRLS